MLGNAVVIVVMYSSLNNDGTVEGKNVLNLSQEQSMGFATTLAVTLAIADYVTSKIKFNQNYSEMTMYTTAMCLIVGTVMFSVSSERR